GRRRPASREARRGVPQRAAGDRESGSMQIEAALHPHGLERGLAADAAAGGCVEMPLEAVEVDVHARCELDPDDVDQAVRRGRAAWAYGGDVVLGADDALGVQEADGELEVLAGRAHRDGDAPLPML